MYRILLLHDQKRGNCRIKEYLELSGYSVDEEEMEIPQDIGRRILDWNLILLNCRDAGIYFSLREKLRYFTDIPIVILTVNDDEWVKIKMFQMGADDYIVEPCSNGELLARLHARLEQYIRLTRSFGCIRSGSLSIEVKNRKVYLKDQEIPMTLREFDTLLYLAQRANVVVSKDELYKNTWDERYIESGYNSVATFVKKIRKKIEPEGCEEKYIETIWGIGYRFLM